MIQRYKKYIRRSCHILEGDITQPYHKYTDLLFKLVSLWFAFLGAVYTIMTPSCYFAFIEGKAAESFSCSYTVGDKLAFPAILNADLASEIFLMQWLLGVGYMLAAIFISQVLVVRHLNETLPDQIYLRCFATMEEKRMRLPMKQ